ncbi:LIM domain only protein 3 isoform X3 [Hemicordylus capensis]|uniref:LIM domain only protein 3 isoform X3 n=1 Tax=Hemicordylus capensis TaxID=884348 RepID=UPI0023039162|nr:LIM domain only protein 3 isoform X3 [Hemicordylus capensis]
MNEMILKVFSRSCLVTLLKGRGGLHAQKTPLALLRFRLRKTTTGAGAAGRNSAAPRRFLKAPAPEGEERRVGGLFGVTGNCAACSKLIPAFEMVMRAKDNVYHLDCFACQLCNQRFCVGDKFFLKNNMILCQTDYEEGLMKEGYAPQVR